MPVSPTMSARANRSESIGSTFSSTMVTEWPAGVSAASSGRQAVGRLHFLPSSGSACSRPQYETWNCGLIRTISAMAAHFERRIVGRAWWGSLPVPPWTARGTTRVQLHLYTYTVRLNVQDRNFCALTRGLATAAVGG